MKAHVAGYQRFVNDMRRAPEDPFVALAQGQRPDALIIACSDSRVSPSVIMQAPLGSLFIMRNAGNIVPAKDEGGAGEAATIEFAVRQLKVRHIVILGHSMCGAMAGLMADALPKDLTLMGQWLKHAAPARKAVEKVAPIDATQIIKQGLACKHNVLCQLANLKTHVCIQEGLRDGTLTLHGWHFELHSGQLSAVDAKTAALTPLGDADVDELGRPSSTRQPRPSKR